MNYFKRHGIYKDDIEKVVKGEKEKGRHVLMKIKILNIEGVM